MNFVPHQKFVNFWGFFENTLCTFENCLKINTEIFCKDFGFFFFLFDSNIWSGLIIFNDNPLVSFSLQEIIGIVYNPITNDFFQARKGHGAFCNGEKLSVTGLEGKSLIIYIHKLMH